jgi:hypothetical protein
MPSLQTHELSQPSPLKRISSRDSDERLFKGRKANHTLEVAGSNHTRDD